VGRSEQRRAACLTGLFALAMDLLFFLVNELPATVPVALALIVGLLRRARRDAPAQLSAQAPAPSADEAPGARALPVR
jgi:hypothetical protein